MWTCHSAQEMNKSLYEIRPRINKLFLGMFHCIVHKCMFQCNCIYKENIFFNEINLGISDNEILYWGLKDFFEKEWDFWIRIANRKNVFLKIILFGECMIKSNDSWQKALKVGFKHEKEIVLDESELINDYYRDFIHEIINKNKNGVIAGEYEVSYIY